MNHNIPGKELSGLKHPMIPAVRTLKLEGLCMTLPCTAKGNTHSRITFQ